MHRKTRNFLWLKFFVLLVCICVSNSVVYGLELWDAFESEARKIAQYKSDSEEYAKALRGLMKRGEQFKGLHNWQYNPSDQAPAKEMNKDERHGLVGDPNDIPKSLGSGAPAIDPKMELGPYDISKRPVNLTQCAGMYEIARRSFDNWITQMQNIVSRKLEGKHLQDYERMNDAAEQKAKEFRDCVEKNMNMARPMFWNPQAIKKGIEFISPILGPVLFHTLTEIMNRDDDERKATIDYLESLKWEKFEDIRVPSWYAIWAFPHNGTWSRNLHGDSMIMNHP